jgi:plasmid maintenance system killer protein
MCISTRYTAPRDQEFPSRWIAAVLQHRLKGWDSAETCEEVVFAAAQTRWGHQRRGYESEAGTGHPLKDDLAGHWAVSVNGSWRLTFTFEGSDAILVDYQDYH